MSLKLNVINAEAVERSLLELPEHIARKVIRHSLRAGAKVVLPVARAGIHNITGKIAASIRIRSAKRGKYVHRGDIALDIIGFAPLEMGHKTFARPGRSRRVAPIGGGPLHHGGLQFVAARPFLGPAYAKTASAAQAAISNDLKSGIEREAAAMNTRMVQ